MAGADAQADDEDEPDTDGLDPIPVPEPEPGCPNCGSVRIAAFCADCGQDQASPRKRWREHLEEIASTYTELDSKTIRSFGMAFTRPGALTELNLENRAGDLVTPVKLFLIVVVLYSIFFALSPIKYGQFFVALEQEWYGPGMEGIASDDPSVWDHNILVYYPEIEEPVSDGFRRSVADGHIDLATIRPAWIARLVQSERSADRVAGRVAAFLIYLPLVLIPAMVAVNGFLFRRRYLLFDHFFLALEAATMMIVVIIGTAGVTALLLWRGIAMDESIPFFAIELPLLLAYLVWVTGRFYRLGFWRAFGAGFAVLVAFLLFQEGAFYLALEIIGRLG